MKLLAVDSNSILNRAYYGLKPLTNTKGQFTHAILGFMNIIHKVQDEIQPDRTVFAFDLKEKTFRHKMYDGYKGTRKGMPEELLQQLEPTKELLRLLGYEIITVPGFEADDILGTISKISADNGDFCFIATGDRDSFQLVSDKVNIRLASTKAGNSVATLVDEAYIREKYDVTPGELIDIKALMGDTSDNIPGVPGVGEKTAIGLIAKFHSLDRVYENIDDPFIKKGVREKLAANKDLAYLSYDLAKINLEVPLPVDICSLPKEQIDKVKTAEFLREYELASLLKRFKLENVEVVQTAKAETVSEDEEISFSEKNISSVEEILKSDCFFYINEDFSALSLISRNKALILSEDDALFSETLEAVNKNSEKIITSSSKEWYKFLNSGEIEPNLIKFDISLAAYIISPNLKSYTPSFLGELRGLSCQRENTLNDSDFEIFKNAVFTKRLYSQLLKEIQDDGSCELLYSIEQPLSKVLALMEKEGFKIDREGLISYGHELNEDLKETEKRIYFLGGGEFNINSPKQLGEVLFERLGLPPKKKTKTGYSTNADVLEELKNHHPIIEEILTYRSLSKLKSTYVDGLLDKISPDGRIHTVFKQTETRTGRISSAEPNLQNIPIKTERGSILRKFFIPNDGCCLVDADYSQIELRVLAHIADDENMKAAFRDGVDIHTKTAAQVFDMPEEFVTPQMRKAAKAVNFGIIYGIGAFSLSKDIGVTVKEADNYIKNYLATYPNVQKYMDSTVAFAKEHGYVETLFHRRRQVPEITASNKITQKLGERIAMNTPIQGTAADIIKLAMIKVFERLKKENSKAKLILQIHDELIVEAPLDEAEKVKQLLTEEMENAVKLSVTLKADSSIGDSWLSAK